MGRSRHRRGTGGASGRGRCPWRRRRGKRGRARPRSSSPRGVDGTDVPDRGTRESVWIRPARRHASRVAAAGRGFQLADWAMSSGVGQRRRPHPVAAAPETRDASAVTSAFPEPTAANFVDWYRHDDDAAVLAAFPRLTEDVRWQAWEALQKPLSKAFRFVRGPGPHARGDAATRPHPGVDGTSDRPGRRCAHRRHEGHWRARVDTIIATRSHEWRTSFASATIHCWAAEPEVGLFGPFWSEWWQWVRRQEQSGLLPVDQASVDYLVEMVRGLLFSGSIVDAVEEDRALADGPVWSLFEPAPAVQKALLGSERFWNPANTWRVALVRLALAGSSSVIAWSRPVGRGRGPEDGLRHRAWYRKIPQLLHEPDLLPSGPEHGAPPPGNLLYPRL